MAEDRHHTLMTERFTGLRASDSPDLVGLGVVASGKELFVVLPYPEFSRMVTTSAQLIERRHAKAAVSGGQEDVLVYAVQHWTVSAGSGGEVVLGVRTLEGAQRNYAWDRNAAEALVTALQSALATGA